MKVFRSLLPAVLLVSLAGCVTSPPAQVAQPPNPKEAEQLAALTSSKDLHERARACQELAVVGGSASVPALAALLDQEHLSDYARSGLEAMRDPAAGAALRSALPRLAGSHLAGAVNSLGVRREKAAVSELQALALDGKRGVGAEAVASLGMIGTAEAAQALQRVLASGPADLRVPAAQAALVAAEHLATEGNPAAARSMLDAVVRAVPSGPVATAAQAKSAALRGGR